MRDFKNAKNGFNKEEVIDYINNLEEQLKQKDLKIEALERSLDTYLTKEKDIKEKGENISIALTAAVEKAKQIENSSKNVYKLKIEELEILYSRWEKVLNEIIEKYPNLEEIDNVKQLLSNFKSALKSSLKEDFKFVNTNNINRCEDPMKSLLSKMNNYLDKQITDKKEVKTKTRIRKQLSTDLRLKQTELNKLEEKSTMIKPIYEARIEKGEKYESLLDKFLTQEAPNSAYANKITAKIGVCPESDSSGFDLKEAVNPKDNLETIMKSFDFFSQG